MADLWIGELTSRGINVLGRIDRVAVLNWEALDHGDIVSHLFPRNRLSERRMRERQKETRHEKTMTFNLFVALITINQSGAGYVRAGWSTKKRVCTDGQHLECNTSHNYNK